MFVKHVVSIFLINVEINIIRTHCKQGGSKNVSLTVYYSLPITANILMSMTSSITVMLFINTIINNYHYNHHHHYHLLSDLPLPLCGAWASHIVCMQSHANCLEHVIESATTQPTLLPQQLLIRTAA